MGVTISIDSVGGDRRAGGQGARRPWYTNFFGDGLTRERHDALVAETHNKRAGRPEEIAETAFFLASPGARHITGQTIHVNGGAFTTR
ncbi:SDR family oxidoreductase [Streptomyces sparsogenes]|uniref:SDR family oxidoreductase n=1 Tax=Streptomyces sparsogenes TaxID=67365 RepID=UPI0033FF884A